MREFHSCKQEEGQSVSSYVLKMKSCIDNLERLGNPVTLGHRQVWNHMKTYADIASDHVFSHIVTDLLPFANRRSSRSVISKLVVAACAYFIWQERNSRLFKKKKRLVKQVVDCIYVSVRLKLLSCRGQNQGKGENKLAYAPKPKIPPPPKREDPAKDSVCHQCEDTS
nr:hypothetical protein [Tanacetum cinerariifolium]